MDARYRGMLREWLFVPLVAFSVVVLLSVVALVVREEPGAGTVAKDRPAGSSSRAGGAGDANAPAPDPNEPNDPNDAVPRRPEHKHAAFRQRIAERRRMVAEQIQARQIRDPNVLRAMRTVPRHAFVPPSQRREAYEDYPLAIGRGQTISQPYVVAFMTEALRLRPNCRVLEIGTGSGYQAAVCAEIAQQVYTIEIVPELAERARKVLKELGYHNVFVRTGDGFFGWPQKGPFDAIIGTAAAGRIPEPLLEQLRPGGRMILPVGGRYGLQYLTLVTKDEQGKITKSDVMPVRFVPMTGQIEKKPGKP